jgi:DNA-binding NtrC family response regulator
MVEAERELIQRALQFAKGNKTRTAQIPGVSRKQLYAKIAQYVWPSTDRAELFLLENRIAVFSYRSSKPR